jgi:PKD repeat protein
MKNTHRRLHDATQTAGSQDRWTRCTRVALTASLSLLCALTLAAPVSARIERVGAHYRIAVMAPRRSTDPLNTSLQPSLGLQARDRDDLLTGDRKATDGSDGPIAGTDPPVLYQGGQVMHVARTHLIIWSPPGFSFPADQTATLAGFLSDVAATPVSADVFGTVSQYRDADGPAAASVPFGGVQIDDASYPASQCATTPAQPACITDDQVRSELTRLVGPGAAEPQDVYIVLLPATVRLCTGDIGCSTGDDVQFCGYHSAIEGAGGTSLVYAVVPQPVDDICELPGGPHDPSSDAEISVITHELLEAATDPLPGTGWVDAQGSEAADACAWLTGPTQVTATGAVYDASLNGGDYLLPEMWTDDGETCVQGYQPAVSSMLSTSNSNPSEDEQVQLQATASDARAPATSWSWSFRGGPASLSAQSANATIGGFGATGLYTVWATMVDAQGSLTTAIARVAVDPKVSAELTASWAAYRGTALPETGYPVAFSAAASSSPGGPLVSYAWSYGDGASGKGLSASHTYQRAGTYTVAVTVVDAEGHIGVASRSLKVIKAPVVRLKVHGALRVGSRLQFSAAGSSPYGSIVRYVWRFGKTRVEATSMGRASHAFSAPGRYLVRVLMIDRAGQSAVRQVYIRIRA